MPVSEGGREQAVLHRICHRMIHRLFDEKRLARDLNTAEALRAAPEMQGFLRWIAKRPPELVDWPELPGRHGRSRRRR
ncbi:hypothetical protein AUP44_03320 [Tistrella mobilis]|uniref:HNH endonuclease n=3 Tax=Tistrella mobilis TaxID=171437 RepID=I3TQ91_TISMK|nr:hypothetical protein TMO_3091 [Tistrella mobilis KA081020-065]KYO54347.1 hypothetical protein AUP44_03320 [Tistrella mobilis]MAM77104.1 HNH endonuclease [Tistrella sp.]